MDPPTLTIGSETQGMSIIVSRRSHAGSTDYWDGNWLSVTVTVAVGRFKASIQGDARAEEFAAFHGQLVPLRESLKGVANLHTLEDWYEINLSGDGKGHIACNGFVMDQPGIGNRLTFNFEIDQTYLNEMLDSLDLIQQKFPIIGHR